ncbi:hypothetical protein EON79_06675 [bacterium]|nr:MAG: hypothetical protein EON79_06675 [bacterium]
MWMLLGLVGDIVLLALAVMGARLGDWVGSVVVLYVLLQAGSAWIQALWVQRKGIELAPAEYAILTGIGTAGAVGLGTLTIFVDNLFVRIGATGGIFLVLIAAPFRALRDAGVRRRTWWVSNLVGACVAMGVLGAGWIIQSRYHPMNLGTCLYLGIKMVLLWFASRPLSDACRKAGAREPVRFL